MAQKELPITLEEQIDMMKKSSADIYTLKILPEQWEILYDEISEF